MNSNPFLIDTDKPYVALLQKRRGYIQVTTSHEVTAYTDLPNEVLTAAKAWAIELEKLEAKRVYWLVLSEIVTHLHIHLFPRWEETEIKGPTLFDQRDDDPQPEWTETDLTALKKWADKHNIHLINPL